MKGPRKNGLKGPAFRSFVQQPASYSSARRYVFNPNVQSTRQCKRNLRTKCKSIIDSTDHVVISVGDRVVRSVCAEPDPEFAALHLFCAALDMADETGQSWTVCMTYLMDKFDGKVNVTCADESEIKADAEVVQKASGSYIGSTISRLLRRLVPRKVQARDVATAKANVD